MGHHLDAMLKRRFRSAKCLALLKLTVARIKVLRNQKHIASQKLRKEIAELLRSGQDSHAYRLKADSLVRLQNTMRAYDLIEQYCNLLSSRVKIMETQRTCPPDVKEAVASLIFAAPRCSDLQELAHVREMFATKYGKEFEAAVAQLRPDCGVNKQIIELLSMRPPTGQMRVKLMKEIAAENKIDWKGDEDEFSKPPADQPGGSAKPQRESEQTQIDSKPDQASTIETVPSASVSSADTGDRKDLPAIPGGDAAILAIAISSLGAHSRPAGTGIAPAESVEGNVSRLTEVSPPSQAGPDELVSASDVTETPEFHTGVQDAVEVSDPESTEGAEVEFLDAVEAIDPDLMEVCEFKMDCQDVAEEIDPDPMEVSEFKMDVQDVVEESSVAALNDEPQEGPDAHVGASETNHDSDAHGDKGSSAEVESPPRTEMQSSKLDEASRISFQKLYGGSDYIGSGKGRQFKDLASAAQAAFESAALAAEAAQAAVELARFYHQEPGHTTVVAGDFNHSSSSENVQAKAAATEIPKARSDYGSKLFESNVVPKQVTEEPKARSEIERKPKDANFDSAHTAILTGARQKVDPNEGEISSSSDDGDVGSRSNLRWNSKRPSQGKTSPPKAGTSHDEVKQKVASNSEESDDDMINPVSLWNRRIPGAHLKNETAVTDVQRPKFDSEEGDSIGYGYGEGFGRTAFVEASHESLEKLNPGLESGHFFGSSSLSTTKKPVPHKHSPFFEDSYEEVGGGKSRFERTGLREELPAAGKGNGGFSHKPKFDEEVNDGRLAPGAIAWGYNREKAEARVPAPAPFSDVGRGSEGQLRWGFSSSNTAEDIHEQRKNGGHRESRRTKRDQRRPSVSPPVEEQKEAAPASVSSGKSDPEVDEHELSVGQWERRRTEREQRRPLASPPIEEQKEAAAASFFSRKSDGGVNEHELKENVGQWESRRTEKEQRRSSASRPVDEQKETAAASLFSRKSDGAVDEHELKESVGQWERRRTEREQRRPTASPAEQVQESAAAAPSTCRKSGDDEFDEVEQKNKGGRGENRRKPIAHQRMPVVSPAEAAFVTSRKDDAELPDLDTNRSSITKVSAKKAAVESHPPAGLSVSSRKNVAELPDLNTTRRIGSSNSKVAATKAEVEAGPRAPLSVSARKNDVEVAAIDTHRPTFTKVASKNADAEAGGSASAAAAAAIFFPPPPSPPQSPPPLPQTQLTSSSSDPGVLAATPPSRPAPSPPRPTASTSSSSLSSPKLSSATSAPSPVAKHTHPKLPDYESLTAQFQKLREEKRTNLRQS